MALTLDDNSQLWAAVNARDFINVADPSLSDEKLPPDTLVQVMQGADYGWPQCYGMGLPSPEYKDSSCAGKALPTALLPAHAAPLGMIFLRPELPLAGLKDGLLIAYHGYRKAGHRIVWQAMDEKGRLAGKPREVLWDWESHGQAKTKGGGFTADGKPSQQGAPVALAQLADGNVLITDDHSGSLLILAVDGPAKP
jgi:glucose/arabinose dehydrogenase